MAMWIKDHDNWLYVRGKTKRDYLIGSVVKPRYTADEKTVLHPKYNSQTEFPGYFWNFNGWNEDETLDTYVTGAKQGMEITLEEAKTMIEDLYTNLVLKEELTAMDNWFEREDIE